MRPLAFVLPVLLWSAAVQAQTAPAPADQTVLQRSQLDAVRAQTQELQRNGTVMETFSNRLERMEAATRGVPPAIEGLRTDVIAIRAALDRLVMASQRKRNAATLKFGPFACGNEGEANCAANACKAVGYANGLAVSVNRTGTGADAKPSSVAEATCYD